MGRKGRQKRSSAGAVLTSSGPKKTKKVHKDDTSSKLDSRSSSVVKKRNTRQSVKDGYENSMLSNLNDFSKPRSLESEKGHSPASSKSAKVKSPLPDSGPAWVSAFAMNHVKKGNTMEKKQGSSKKGTGQSKVSLTKSTSSFEKIETESYEGQVGKKHELTPFARLSLLRHKAAEKRKPRKLRQVQNNADLSNTKTKEMPKDVTTPELIQGTLNKQEAESVSEITTLQKDDFPIEAINKLEESKPCETIDSLMSKKKKSKLNLVRDKQVVGLSSKSVLLKKNKANKKKKKRTDRTEVSSISDKAVTMETVETSIKHQYSTRRATHALTQQTAMSGRQEHESVLDKERQQQHVFADIEGSEDSLQRSPVKSAGFSINQKQSGHLESGLESETDTAAEGSVSSKSPQTTRVRKSSEGFMSPGEQNSDHNPKQRVPCIATETGALAILKHPNVYVIEGQARLKVLSGSIEVHGHKIDASHQAVDMFSVTFQSFLTIQTCSGESDQNVTRRTILQHYKKDNNFAEISQLIKGRDLISEAVILCVEMETSENVDYIRSFYPKLFSTDLYDLTSGTRDALSSMELQIYQQGEKSLSSLVKTEAETILIEKWTTVLKHCDQGPPIAVLCGAKHCGKSTACRNLINSTLNSHKSLFYLECDVGQTEFTPPGCVSLSKVEEPLLGPPFCHQRKPVGCSYFGGVTASDNPDWYLQCVTKCCEAYRKLGTNVPLIVNTMGWVSGMGLQLLLDILRLVKPSLVVQLKTGKYIHDCSDLTPDFVAKESSWRDIHQISSVAPGSSTDSLKSHGLLVLNSSASQRKEKFELRPAEKRSLNLLSHLSSDLEPGLTLTSAMPYKLPWDSVVVHASHVSVPRDQIMYALNASVVGLCYTDISSPQVEKLGEDLPMFFKTSTPDCQCVGFGIVRAVDPKEKVFYVVTSVSVEDMKRVNALMKGSVGIPDCVLMNQDKRTDLQHMYISQGLSTVGSGMLRQRRYMPRKQLVN